MSAESFRSKFHIFSSLNDDVKDTQKHNADPGGWVEKYSDYLFNYAVVRLSDPEQAADVVQDTLLAALRAMNNFKGESSEKTWLTSILKRKIIDIYRRRSRENQTSLDSDPSVEDRDFFEYAGPFPGHWREEKMPHSNSLMPEGEVENKELREILEKCIEALPENLSSVFIMKMIDDASSEDICKELDLTPSNVWVILHRARLKLRNCIETNWR